MIEKTNFKKIFIGFFTLLELSACIEKPSKHREDFLTVFEKSEGTESASYEEGMNWWKRLDEAFEEVTIQELGLTDAGIPLHLVLIHDKGVQEVASLNQRTSNVIFINNAIHPGEPDGVDASMMLARDILVTDSLRYLLKGQTLAIIPYYNIGGALNRNNASRTNQLGPMQYGFRGNAQNLDLNRDFIKSDSKNAKSFAQVFHALDPDMYIETHVSNGANYRYTMTLLPTLYQKLDEPLAAYFKQKWEDKLYEKMAEKQEEMCPYVNVFETPPDSGMQVFIDAPRYSSGFAALFQTPGFITETLMLKPFKNRVMATYKFLLSALEISEREKDKLRKTRMAARAHMLQNKEVVLDWLVDETRPSVLPFKGFQSVYRYSAVTGDTLLTYDADKPVDLVIPYYREVKPVIVKEMPRYFVLQNGFDKVMDLLAVNKVTYRILQKDTLMTLTLLKIDTFTTVRFPYEGHYAHSNTRYSTYVKSIKVPAGSWLIDTRQPARRYLAEVFFPDAPDAFFNWNYFDSRLQQKEWYSSYVFEKEAQKMLDENDKLRQSFEEKIKSDSAFAANPRERLYYLYKQSPHYEWHHQVLPVYLIY